MSPFVFFCIQILLIEHAFSQRANGPTMVNNGLGFAPNQGPFGPNTGLGGPAIQGQQLGRMPQELGGVIPGSAMGPMGPNQVLNPYGMQNAAYGGIGMPNAAYGGAGYPSQTYGGAGNGDVAVSGELPVAGMTAVTGQVPLTGKVAFSGNVPCGGIVTISGTCTGGCNLGLGGNAPYGQIPAYGNKPYGY